MKKDFLTGKKLTDIEAIVKDNYLPRYTARQITDWLYKKNISSFDGMTNLSKETRKTLNDNFEIGRLTPVREQISVDGTKKYLFPTLRGKHIETTVIPDKERLTVCVSTQVGCKMGCVFCLTGRQGYQGNLSAGEILNQTISLPERNKITNIVYMGMGEPLDNMDNVLDSLEIITSGYGLAMSPRRITVSTIGIIPAIRRFIEDTECNLAVSLHTPFEEERRKIMPSIKISPLSEIIKTISEYDFGKQRRISFEYIMFRGFNDLPRHVKELTRLLNRLKCRINLIRFNPFQGSILKPSDDNNIEIFKDALNEKGILTTTRQSRGQDISAACGMLTTKKIESGKQKI
jgi:23S rRNA (adenine2503-C2)-methyltransferase